MTKTVSWHNPHRTQPSIIASKPKRNSRAKTERALTVCIKTLEEVADYCQDVYIAALADNTLKNIKAMKQR